MTSSNACRSSRCKPIVLAAKLAYDQRHEHCRGVIIVRHDRIEADLHVRTADAWTRHELRDASTFPISSTSAHSAISTGTRRSIRKSVDAGGNRRDKPRSIHVICKCDHIT